MGIEYEEKIRQCNVHKAHLFSLLRDYIWDRLLGLSRHDRTSQELDNLGHTRSILVLLKIHAAIKRAAFTICRIDVNAWLQSITNHTLLLTLLPYAADGDRSILHLKG